MGIIDQCNDSLYYFHRCCFTPSYIIYGTVGYKFRRVVWKIEFFPRKYEILKEIAENQFYLSDF